MLRVVADVAPRFVFAENVSKKAIDAAADDLDALGYETRCIPFGADDLGSDHSRTRYWLLAYADDPRELLRGLNAEVAELPSMARRVWESDPGSAGVSDGVAYRMDRISATGNGWVSGVAIAALSALIDSVVSEMNRENIELCLSAIRATWTG